MSRSSLRCLLLTFLAVLLCSQAFARNPIRRAFYDLYPVAVGTQLDDLPSNPGHCGVCHFDFDGGGQRNPFGLAVEVGVQGGLSNSDAILAAMGFDSDNDGYGSLQEVTDVQNFSNTPTFPGLKLSNLGSVLNVDPAEVEPYLTPAGATDTTPPVVTVLWPNGGETLQPNSLATVSWTASDDGGIAGVDLYLTDDAGAHAHKLAEGLPHTGSFDLFIPNLPSPTTRLVVEAHDPAGNAGEDMSDADWNLAPWTQGAAPTTLRDFELPGTQPFGSSPLDDPQAVCASCHADVDPVADPWNGWAGSMMGNTMRDPVFIATMVIAEQDAPASGDLCLRCHTPGGWAEGRSSDTSGGMVTAKDRHGVQCDFCHRQVDPVYQAGVSPIEDVPILDELDAIPAGHGNGQFVLDPDPVRRGPYADAQADHLFLDSPFHRSSDLCGTCHDVSNPVFLAGATPGFYEPAPLDAPHPTGDKYDMFPVERTYSEWSVSEYALSGVYAPQFAGDKPDGVVSTCQDCHMADVTGSAAIGGPNRTDIGAHDLTGGNHFVPDIIPDFFPGEQDPALLAAGKARVVGMLQKAATLELSEDEQGAPGVNVRVINETGHKLPSGYPEGRRIWLNVKAYDIGGTLVYESGAYDFDTGVLTHDEDAKVYHIEPGTSTRLGSLLGIPDGPSFHFVLNDTVYLDNRIPPRGFTNAAFTSVQSPPVGYAYEDGQYWDDTHYDLPFTAETVDVTLYYQSISKEYVEFLRDENRTNDYGQQLHDAWVAQGRAAPVAMATASLALTVTGAEDAPAFVTDLQGAFPNPFNPTTKLAYTLAVDGRASLRIHDQRGRVVRTLLDGVQTRGAHEAVWDGRDDRGRGVGSGVYFAVLRAGEVRRSGKLVLMK